MLNGPCFCCTGAEKAVSCRIVWCLVFRVENSNPVPGTIANVSHYFLRAEHARNLSPNVNELLSTIGRARSGQPTVDFSGTVPMMIMLRRTTSTWYVIRRKQPRRIIIIKCIKHSHQRTAEDCFLLALVIKKRYI